ncbi:hypothetical protein CALVIDRAFT_556164 [Calocera viscosa TUFC12733]|uniref:Uncharacterized protein n=1 Tax=Calocera viscosa (strain TUFC12733) TaxID=1330018 RepID=A0A167KGW4_CALVF|nr:hypothetical protein CALVIDRAFT_556164 [Calocera viscosa TUFC12733]
MFSLNRSITDYVLQQRHIAIHRLNADTLLHIFSFCRDAESISVWAISHICSRWRALTLEQSSLWTRIVVDRPTVRYLGSISRSTWLDTWISRSGATRPLDIVLDLTQIRTWYHKPTSADVNNLLLVTCYQAHRWSSFTYMLGPLPEGALPTWYLRDEDIYEEIRGRLRSLPLLESIYLSQDRRSTNYGITPTHVQGLLYQGNAPRLRHMSLVNINFISEFDRPKVDHLSYTISNEDSAGAEVVLHALRAYSSVTSLDLSGWARLGMHRGPRRLVLEHLQELKVVPNQFMADVTSMLEMSNLAQLTVDGTNVINTKEVLSDAQLANVYTSYFLQDLAIRSVTFSLKTLVLYLPHEHVPWLWITLFYTLETLRIIKPAEDSFWLNCPAKMPALCRPNLQEGSPWSLPRLGLLVIEKTKSHISTTLDSTAGWRQFELRMKVHFKARWKSARRKEAAMVSLIINLIADDRKIEFGDPEGENVRE